jgi:pyruvate/2-oxoglutarate dehydrogenase complex dihydrolipoamide dehydrogenase (E3) component
VRTQGIEVDGRLRTANPRIFAAGDCCTGRRYAHAAEAMARLVVRNAFFGGREEYSSLVVPRCVFTAPEVAQVGETATELAARGVRFETIAVPLAENDRALIDGTPEGFLRLHHRKGKDEILGATLVADHAAESIAELGAAIQHGLGLARLAATVHPYPTQSAVVQRAAETYERERLTPFSRRVIGLWMRRLERRARRDVQRQAEVPAPAPAAEA